MDCIKQYDTWPYLQFSFTDAELNPVDCTDFSVRLVVRDRKKNIVIEAFIGEENSEAYWTNNDNGLSGIGEYHWKSEDTAEQGIYEYEFKFLRTIDNKQFTLPQNGYFYFAVNDDIAKWNETP